MSLEKRLKSKCKTDSLKDKIKINNINLHFSHQARDFSHLTPGFQISG